jgi:hypothetical protein
LLSPSSPTRSSPEPTNTLVVGQNFTTESVTAPLREPPIRAAVRQDVSHDAHEVLRWMGHAGVLEAHGTYGGHGAGGQRVVTSVRPAQRQRRCTAGPTPRPPLHPRCATAERRRRPPTVGCLLLGARLRAGVARG